MEPPAGPGGGDPNAQAPGTPDAPTDGGLQVPGVPGEEDGQEPDEDSSADEARSEGPDVHEPDAAPRTGDARGRRPDAPRDSPGLLAAQARHNIEIAGDHEVCVDCGRRTRRHNALQVRHQKWRQPCDPLPRYAAMLVQDHRPLWDGKTWRCDLCGDGENRGSKRNCPRQRTRRSSGVRAVIPAAAPDPPTAGDGDLQAPNTRPYPHRGAIHAPVPRPPEGDIHTPIPRVPEGDINTPIPRVPDDYEGPPTRNRTPVRPATGALGRSAARGACVRGPCGVA